ncbi:hypothetical protein J6590_098413, partial [Homalodisca vitripennis]
YAKIACKTTAHSVFEMYCGLKLPPRSPDLKPLEVSFWHFIKEIVNVPSLPTTLPELRARIYAAAVKVTPTMLVLVWEEIDYRLNVIENVTRYMH